MESLTIILTFLLSLFLIFKLLPNKKSDPSKPLNLIPGPKRLPVIGNLHLLAGNTPPHHVFRKLSAQYGPLMRIQLGGLPYLIVSTVEVAKEVLRTHDLAFSNRPPGLAAEAFSYNYTGVGFAPYGEPWRVLKKLCTVELLSMKRVRSFRHVRQEETENLVRFITAAAGDGAAVDLSEKVHLLAYDIVTRASVGATTKDRLKVMHITRGLGNFGAGFNAADLYPSVKVLPFLTGIQFKIEKMHREMDGMFQEIIAEARAAEKDDGFEDLLGILLKCQAEGSEMAITDDDIKAVMLDMFLAGSETSAAVIEWAMSEMVKNPVTLKKAQEEVRKVFDKTGRVDEERIHELEYLPLAIKETLRIHPPLPFMMPRLNSSKCTLNGYEIPSNTRLIVHAWALGRDPQYWPDAEQFIPERFQASTIDYKGNDFQYLPFGSGRRLCPGMNFGVANSDLALATLLYHFDWEMPRGLRNQDLDMVEDFAITVRRKNPLILVPTLKRPLNVGK
ncbi:cytochrome P450 71D10-like [Salvia hispanica]|uniref:cytochrome P450 71D10-like n=1 Tax=Salvia hispanica TaxID=49212 RepID=UPI002009D5F7|nr:cytochrome P450 71D10-like [Salvia hispanica]